MNARISLTLAAVLLAVVAAPKASAAGKSALWARLRRPLMRHIKKVMLENDGLFVIDDINGYDTYLGKLKKVYSRRMIEVGEWHYIVRALFIERKFEGEGTETSTLLVDFTLMQDDTGKWNVTDQVLYGVDKKRYFTYSKTYRRVPLEAGEAGISVIIEGEGGPEQPGSEDGEQPRGGEGEPRGSEDEPGESSQYHGEATPRYDIPGGSRENEEDGEDSGSPCSGPNCEPGPCNGPDCPPGETP